MYWVSYIQPSYQVLILQHTTLNPILLSEARCSPEEKNSKQIQNLLPTATLNFLNWQKLSSEYYAGWGQRWMPWTPPAQGEKSSPLPQSATSKTQGSLYMVQSRPYSTPKRIKPQNHTLPKVRQSQEESCSSFASEAGQAHSAGESSEGFSSWLALNTARQHHKPHVQ